MRFGVSGRRLTIRFCARIDKGRQEVAIADYLTRVYAQSDGAELVSGGANFYDTSRDLLRIDSNGNAPDFGAEPPGETSVANCSFLGNVSLNNGVTLDVQTQMTDERFLRRVTEMDQDRCVFRISWQRVRQFDGGFGFFRCRDFVAARISNFEFPAHR